MTMSRQFIASAGTQLTAKVILSAIWAIFAVVHITVFKETGKTSLMMFAAAETLIAAFFLLRSQPKSFSESPLEWLIAALGTFLPLLLRPTNDNLVPLAEWGLILGATMQAAGVLSLNKSFALIPALREIKTEGMYRVVRHPIYLSYMISFTCYLLTNYSFANLFVVSASVGLLVARVHYEERHLSLTPEYRAYQTHVRWRLIPFVF